MTDVVYSYGSTFQDTGQPSTPNLYRGVIANTGIQFTNNDLSHSCDIRFVLDINTGIGQLLSGLLPNFSPLFAAMQAGQNDAAKAIRGMVAKLIAGFRLAVKGIQAALNLDTSGVLSRLWSDYKQVIRKINEYIKTAAQIVYDISFVIGLVNNIQAIIKWIESLPDYLKKLLQDCLSNFTNSIKNIGTQIQQTVNNIKTVGPAAVNAMLAQATTAQTSSQSNSQFNDSFSKTITDPLNSGVDAISSGISNLSASVQATVSSSRSNTPTQKP